MGIAVGVAAVVLLTSIGEGVHRFVLSEFTQFGTNLVAINPGKVTTGGVSMGVFGTQRPLTIADAEALKRLPYAKAVVAFVQGNAEVEAGNRSRRTTIYGTGAQMPEALQMAVKSGRFLPNDDPAAPRAFAVLGSKLKQELFNEQNPLGQRITVGGYRFRIIGVMESKGNVLGFDLDDTIYIPAARALSLFNRNTLHEIDLLYDDQTSIDTVVNGIRATLTARHGRDDVTITTQQQMLEVLGSVLNVLTFAVGAIGGISLLVGAIGIVTIMTIAVNERSSEIGLLRALGAKQSQVLSLFLGEAIVPFLPWADWPDWDWESVLHNCCISACLACRCIPHGFFVVLAEVIAISIGLIAGVLPARRAARLGPCRSATCRVVFLDISLSKFKKY